MLEVNVLDGGGYGFRITRPDGSALMQDIYPFVNELRSMTQAEAQQIGDAFDSSGGPHWTGSAVVPAISVADTHPVARANEAVNITAVLPANALDSEVSFQLDGGAAYLESVNNTQASHPYAFANPGIYRITISSAHHGETSVEVTVQ